MVPSDAIVVGQLGPSKKPQVRRYNVYIGGLELGGQPFLVEGFAGGVGFLALCLG